MEIENKLYDTITPVYLATQKQQWLELLGDSLQDGIVPSNVVIQETEQLEIDKLWAEEIITNQANCVLEPYEGFLGITASHWNQVTQWRTTDSLQLPNACSSCKSNPEKARTRCPILFGNRLEVERTDEGIVIDGKFFPGKIALNIGGGTLLESFGIARPGIDAVIVVDPKANVGMDIWKSLNEGNYDETILHLRRNYGSLRNADASILELIKEQYKQADLSSDIFLVNNTFEGVRKYLPANSIDLIMYSYPSPGKDIETIERDSINLIEFAAHSLRKDGKLILRTEYENLFKELGKAFRSMNKIFRQRSLATQPLPPTVYDTYFKSKYNDPIYGLLIEKK